MRPTPPPATAAAHVAASASPAPTAPSTDGPAPNVQGGSATARVQALVARLRAPGGCAWDAEQTHASLVPHLLEEAAEAAAAARAGDADALCDELGDVLLQVLLHAQVAQEAGRFDFAAVADNLANKLVRRHPHVFAGERADDGAAAEASWERVKDGERAGRPTAEGALAGVPAALPALQRAQKISRRAAKAGFEWPDVEGPLAKLDEEMGEVREAMATLATALADGNADAQFRAHAALADELGDALFSLVNVARHLKVDAEETLHATVERFAARFGYVEAALGRRGLRAGPAHVDLMGQLWQEAKRNLA